MIEEKEILKDYKIVKLGEVCEIVSGNTPKGLDKISNKSGIAFYKVSDMNLQGNEVEMKLSKQYLTNEEIKKLKIKIYPKGTVIFPKRGGAILTNKKRLLSAPATFDLNLMGVLPNEKIESKFLYYWFQKLDLSKIYDGSNVPQINNKNIAPLNFPFPPLHEQQAIVSKIEELFSELDKGIEQLKTTQEQLKVYRQSVLKWAFEGKLTEAWREKQDYLKNAEELIEEILVLRKSDAKTNNKKIKQVENLTEEELSQLSALPKKWMWTKLNDITFLITDGTHLRPTYTEKGIPFLSVKNVRPGKISDNDVKFISKEQHESYIKRCKPEKGDILYTKVGATYGYAAINHLNYEFSIYVSLCLIKYPQRYILPKFIEYGINSNLIYKQAQKRIKGIGRPDLHLEEIRDFHFPLCPVEEQKQIVQEIESRLSVADKLEETINNSLQQAEALRQSILKKAFEGRLI